MFKHWAVYLFIVLCAETAVLAQNAGRTPTPEEIAAWDVSIAADGRELPPGSGTVEEGARLYALRCEECHGPEAKGGDQAALAGGVGSLASAEPKKTVNSYWPHATTVFDYIRRAMPFKEPGTLPDEQVYAVVAYILSLDGIVAPDATLDRESLMRVEMPNRDGFVRDPR